MILSDESINQLLHNAKKMRISPIEYMLKLFFTKPISKQLNLWD